MVVFLAEKFVVQALLSRILLNWDVPLCYIICSVSRQTRWVWIAFRPKSGLICCVCILYCTMPVPQPQRENHLSFRPVWEGEGQWGGASGRVHLADDFENFKLNSSVCECLRPICIAKPFGANTAHQIATNPHLIDKSLRLYKPPYCPFLPLDGGTFSKPEMT